MINASTIAFVNSASVPMRGLVLASAVGRRPLQGTSIFVVDPNDEEIRLLDASACFAFLFASDLGNSSSDCELVWSDLQTKSFFTDAELSSARELAKSTARKIWMDVKDSLPYAGSRQQWTSAPDDTKSTIRVPIEADDDDAKMEI
jgi:exosome complex component RRP46